MAREGAIQVIMDQQHRVPWVEKAQQQLEEHGIAEVTFFNVYSRYDVRREVYRYFRGYEIRLDWEKDPFGNDPRHRCVGRLVITDTRTRSLSADADPSRPETASSKASWDPEGFQPTQPGAHAKRIGRVPNGFDSEDIHDRAGMRWCPVCQQWHPSSMFAWRDRGHNARQSYCKRCNKLYQRWRYVFLKEHNATVLVDEFTQGGRNVNPLFKAWLAEHHPDILPKP